MRKKLHKITAALLVFASVCSIACFDVFAEQDLDIDGDGIVSINDVTILQMYLAAYHVNFSDYQLAVSDINGDGIVDINDCTSLQFILSRPDYENTDETDTYLLEDICDVKDKNYSGTVYKLTSEERDYVEKIVSGEFGISYTGSVCIAQCIRDALVYGYIDNPMNLGKSPSQGGLGYAGYEDPASENAKDAVSFVFDKGGSAVQHRMLAMCTEDYYNKNPGNWHSTQNFIMQFENVLFFDYWY